MADLYFLETLRKCPRSLYYPLLTKSLKVTKSIIYGAMNKLRHFFIGYFVPVNFVPNTKTLWLPTLIKNDSNALFLREQIFKGWYAKS